MPNAERIHHHRRCCKWLPPASIHSCARLIMLRYTRCNAWLILSFRSRIVCGFDSYTALCKCPQRISRYRNWLTSATQSQQSKSLCYIRYTATRCQHDCWLTVQTLRNIHTNARENITRTSAKPKAGYFFMAHPVCIFLNCIWV